MGNGYAVDTTSAEAVAAATETKIADLDTLKTSLTDPLASARAALPDGFAAIARLETLQTDHTTDVDTIKTYATSCVTGLRSCLAIYENSTAEMVAEQKATEAKVVFTHDGLLDYAAKPVNDKLDEWEKPLNNGMPKGSEGTSTKTTYESSSAHDGSHDKTTSSQSNTAKGWTTATGSTYEYDGRGPVNTSERTYTTSSTHHGVTDTTTYYNGTSFQNGGGNEAHATGKQFAVSSGGKTHATYTEGSMKVPVAP